MEKKKKENLEELDTNALIYRLLSDRVGAVNPHEVFYATEVRGKYHCILGGKKLTKNQLGNLQSETMLLEKMELWKVFTQTLAHEANMRMFKQAKTERDLDWGKAILHAISIMETLVKAIQNAQVEELSTGKV